MESAVFQKVDSYLTTLFSLEDSVLKQTEQSIRNNNMPEHSVSANQGQFLSLLAKLCQAKRIIEVGSLGGYSTIWLGRAVKDIGKVTSIEVEPSFADVARNNIEKAKLSETVEIITGDALQVLKELEKDKTPVDLFFMDADKPNYINYFNQALKMSRKGSLIIADNVIRNGKVLDVNSQDEKVIGVREYNSYLANNKKVTTSIFQQVGEKEYDGIAISLVL